MLGRKPTWAGGKLCGPWLTQGFTTLPNSSNHKVKFGGKLELAEFVYFCANFNKHHP